MNDFIIGVHKRVLVIANFRIATVIIYHSFWKTSTPKSFTFKNSLILWVQVFLFVIRCQLLHIFYSCWLLGGSR